jgi:hypothetical protein
MPIHEASEGGKLSVLARTLALFIEGKAQMFMLFIVGYSFFTPICRFLYRYNP